MPKERRSTSIRLSAALIFAVALTGCATAPWPRAPSRLTQEDLLADAKAEQMAGRLKVPPIMTVRDAKLMVEQLDHRLENATGNRRAMELTLDDITFFGTLTAVAGVAGKSIAARNIGAGVAGLASAITGHYNPKGQRIAFMTAWGQTQCLMSALNGIDSSVYKKFPLSADGKKRLGTLGGQDGTQPVDADLAYSEIPQITYDRVGDIVLQLSNSLDAIQTSGASLSDIRTIATQVSEAAKAASSAPAVVNSASKLKLDAANIAQKKASHRVSTLRFEIKQAKSQKISGSKSPAVPHKANASELSTQLSEARISSDKAAKAKAQALAKAKKHLAKVTAQKNEIIADIAVKTAFLSAVVQYKASANACAKLVSVQ